MILANVYALALKLSLQDTAPDADTEADLHRHAIRRSRPAAITFMLIHPLSMLGIFLSGVGFVAAILGKPLAFSRYVMCCGAALTWVVTAATKSLHSPAVARVHNVKTALTALCSLVFLAPLAFRLPQLATSALVAANAVVLLAGLVASEFFLQPRTCMLKHWTIRPPRPLKTWDTAHHLVGANVTGLEHFFTVLSAVAVFQLNERLQEAEHTWATVELYALHFFVLYELLAHTMRYASHFNDDDLWHKFLWSAFQVALLLMLEGAGGGEATRFSMYKVVAISPNNPDPNLNPNPNLNLNPNPDPRILTPTRTLILTRAPTRTRT